MEELESTRASERKRKTQVYDSQLPALASDIFSKFTHSLRGLMNCSNINTSPKKGVLAKYKHLVGSASKGAVTDSYDQ